MESKIMKDIVSYAKEKLQTHAGYCGVADGGNFVMINSEDKDIGKDIIINFKLSD